MQLPTLSGNWVDFIIIAFVLFYIWEGWQRGFIATLADLCAFLGGFIGAIKLYPFLARLLMTNFSFAQGFANAMSFLLLGLLLEQLVALGLSYISQKIPPQWSRNPLNLIFSFVPLLGNVCVILAFVLSLVLALPLKTQIKKAVSESKLAQPIIAQTQSLERALGSIFGEALADTFNFITIQPVSEERVQLNFTQRELMIDPQTEDEMLRRVNAERRNAGLSELAVSVKLRDLARVYAKDMFERGYFSHYNPEGESPFDRMEKAGIVYRSAGENLALAPNVTIAHQGLMDSPGHRKNILSNDYGTVGIGVIDGGVYGKMFVQEFTN